MHKPDLKIFIACILFFCLKLNAQTASDSSKTYLKVYLDGFYYGNDYVKREINFVSYVRDRFEAQVHVLFAYRQTGSGGQEITIFLTGQKEFAGKNDTLKYIALKNASEDEIRSGTVQVLKMELLSYVAKLPRPPNVQIQFDTTSTSDEKQEDDKWNSWVYTASVSGDAGFQKFYQYISGSAGLSANRITEKFKTNIFFGANYSQSVYDLGSGDKYTSILRSDYAHVLIVKSLNNHWSAGGEANYNTSDYNNFKFHGSFAPAIEYDAYPYSQSTSELLTFFYEIIPSYTLYNDTTLYGKTKEFLVQQILNVSLSYKQKWGSLSTGVGCANFMHDFSKNNFSVYSSAYLKLFSGLSINGYFSFQIIHDQLGLPKSGATDEEVLLQVQELETNYNFSAYFGLSYTFGSIYNNVVNPRFDGSYSYY